MAITKRSRGGQNKASPAQPVTSTSSVRDDRAESTTAYRFLLEHLPIGVYRSAPSGALLDANPALLRLLGYPDRETLLRVPLNQIYVEAGRRRQFKAEMDRTGYVNNFEATIRRADNTVLTVLTTAYAQRHPDGRVCCYEGIVVDVTENRRREERLNLQAAALEAAADGIMVTDAGGAIEWVNPAFTRLTGYTLADVRGKNPRLLKSGRHDRPFYTTLWSTIQVGQVWHGETVNRRKDGTLYTEEQTIAPVLDRAGKTTHFVAIKHDITARKQAEKARDRLIAILEATPDFVGTADTSGRPTYLNRGGQRMLGTGSAEMANETILDAYPEPARDFIRTEALPAAIRDGQWHGEATLLSRDGVEIPVSQVIIAHKAPDGTVEFLSTIMRDITERKDAERQLREQLDHLAALREIDRAIMASTDLHVTLDVVLDKVTSQLSVDAADILLLDPVTNTLNHFADRGFRSNALRHTHLRLGEGHAGRAAHEGRRIDVSDLAAFPPARAPLLTGEGFTAYTATPLIAKGAVKGVLECFRRKQWTPDSKWLDLLETLAGQAAIAIENANLLVDLRRSSADLVLAYDATLAGWSRALDLRDQVTSGHSQRVTEMTLRLARALGMSPADMGHVRRGALLHDVGKMGVPDAILQHTGPLTDDQWQVMRRHPTYAYELLRSIEYLRPALDIPYCHHERWNGTGYPRGLRGTQIPLAARVFAVADVWDALRSDRPYRAAWSRERVLEYIRAQAGTAFDPDIVETFVGLERDGHVDSPDPSTGGT